MTSPAKSTKLTDTENQVNLAVGRAAKVIRDANSAYYTGRANHMNRKNDIRNNVSKTIWVPKGLWLSFLGTQPVWKWPLYVPQKVK